MIIDTHAHLNTETFDSELDAVIERASLADVKKIIVIGMNNKANSRALELSDRANLYATVGLHPSDVLEGLDIELLKQQSKHPKVVAIGEIGIDLYWVKDNLELQIQVFKRQLELAIELDLPVVIHMRDSANEIYEVVKHYPQLKGVMHCFSASLDWAMKFIELGFYIGIGGPVTFKNNLEAKQVATQIPLDRLLLETDSPYLAPVPYRGKQNEPAYTKLVVLEIAKLRDISVEEVSTMTTRNAMRLFRIEED
ncbi:TatD family hydrolase [Acholeplasma vituli]|uniref:TatD family hydrolase n=1 Tax=Paracholeplasma vituli TaxID=69473 RepID=A0ABT2PVG2_9MOLU|nr:TatD family hydrolase [Paracholeplasma vituli]MCU0104329.1 TatD family hydrolase [Paracholeplasma vituli]